jgi:hypothetical protein
MIRVTRQGEAASAIGQVIDGSADGSVTLSINVQAATWSRFDTIEVFTNAVPDVNDDVTVLQPAACWTPVAEVDLDPADPCASAPLGATQLTVGKVEVAPGFERYEATVSITLDRDQPLYPDGASGKDVWVVVRARGSRAIYPMLLLGAVSSGNLDTLVSGTEAEIDTALEGIGMNANAVTGAIYLDLDGGGYRAPFAPE